jgi:hypothetical protein
METSAVGYWKSRVLSFLALLMLAVYSVAQDGGGGGGEGLNVDVNVGDEGGAWYTSPWIWVGVAAFIVILVLAMRSGSAKAD